MIVKSIRLSYNSISWRITSWRLDRWVHGKRVIILFLFISKFQKKEEDDGMQRQAGKQNLNRSTCLFVVALLLGGLLNFNELKNHPYLPDTLVHCAVFTIYSTLLLFWMQTVRDRLTRSQSRRYTLAAACFMLLYLLSRTMKYRMIVPPLGTRAFWYLNYTPLIAMPTLFLMTCIRFHTAKESPAREMVLLVPAGGLLALVLTNDLHCLAFRPKIDLALLEGKTGTYTYGPVYYMVYVWIGLTIATGIFLLLLKARQLRDWKKAVPPLLFLALIPILDHFNDVLSANGYHRVYGTPEIHIFCMLGVFESCIRSRLMPRNENYPGFFAHMDIPAMITDGNLLPVFRTAAPLDITDEQMNAALKEPLDLDADTRLFGRALHAGCAFWSVDDSTLHRLNEHLEEANETIGLENKLIQYENEQREEKARIDARNAVYAKAAAELYPVQKWIAALLDGMQPGTPDFRTQMAKVCMLNAFVKRKTNFILTYTEEDRIDAEELCLAVREVAGFLNEYGVSASVERQPQAGFSYADTLALFDTFLEITELFASRISRMMVFIRADGLHMTVDGTLPESMPQFSRPVISEEAEGLLFLAVSAEGGDAL